VDKDTIVCIVGAVILVVVLAYVAILATKNVRHAPPTLIDKLPDIIQQWRNARTFGERALIVGAMIGTTLRRGGQLIVAVCVVGVFVNAFAALCSSSSLEILRALREILRDVLYGLRIPVRPLEAH